MVWIDTWSRLKPAKRFQKVFHLQASSLLCFRSFSTQQHQVTRHLIHGNGWQWNIAPHPLACNRSLLSFGQFGNWNSSMPGVPVPRTCGCTRGRDSGGCQWGQAKDDARDLTVPPFGSDGTRLTRLVSQVPGKYFCPRAWRVNLEVENGPSWPLLAAKTVPMFLFPYYW